MDCDENSKNILGRDELFDNVMVMVYRVTSTDASASRLYGENYDAFQTPGRGGIPDAYQGFPQGDSAPAEEWVRARLPHHTLNNPCRAVVTLPHLNNRSCLSRKSARSSARSTTLASLVRKDFCAHTAGPYSRRADRLPS